MKGIIYRATNQFSGKVYIGQTIAGLNARRGQHLKDAKSDHTNEFHRALYQYPESFDWEILDEFSGEPEAVIHWLNVAEEYHIIKHDSTNPERGYNSTGGGYSSDKFAGHIARRAKALSGQSKQILQYDTDGNFVQEFESLNAVAAFLKIDKVQSRVLLSGLHYGYQWREKMSEIFPKKIHAYRMLMKRMVGIAVYDSNGNFIGKFKNKREAHTRFGCNGVVRDAICDINTTEAKMRGFYFFRLGDSEPPEKININVKRTARPEPKPQNRMVSAYTINGEYVETFDSISLACLKMKTSHEVVRRYCESSLPIVVPAQSNAKYVWRYGDGGDKGDIEVIVRAQQRPVKKGYKIIQYSPNGEFIKVWDNTNQAAEQCGYNYNAIRKCLKGMRAKAANFIWRYFTPDYPTLIEMPKCGDRAIEHKIMKEKKVIVKPVAQYGIDGNLIAVFESKTDAMKKTSTSYGCIIDYCRKTPPIYLSPNSRSKYIWQFATDNTPSTIEVIDHRAKHGERVVRKYQPDGTMVWVKQRMTENKLKRYSKMEHRIIQYSLEGEFIKVWDNTSKAAEAGEDSANIIRKILKGGKPKGSNYIWRYFTQKYPERINPDDVSARSDDAIAELDYTGKTIATFKSPADAAKKTGLSQSYICNILAGRIKHPSRRFERIGGKKS